MSLDTENTGDLWEKATEIADEATGGLLSEIKETYNDLIGDTIRDILMVSTLVRTIGLWVLFPLSHDIAEVKEENKKRASDGKKPNILSDYALLKNIIVLSMAYLVLDPGSDGEDEKIMQFVFLLFFVGFIFIFISALWIWKAMIGMKVGNGRVFTGYIVYEYATIYLFSFVITGPLGMDTMAENDDSDMLLLVVYAVTLLHAVYWMFRLMAHYQLPKVRRVIGAVSGIVVLAVLLLIPVLINGVFLSQESGDQTNDGDTEPTTELREKWQDSRKENLCYL
jgi:hypothetical protein